MTTAAEVTGIWSPGTSAWCICPDYVLRRLIRHTPWRPSHAFVCQCGAVWRYTEAEDL